MKISLYAIGKTDFKFVKEGLELYLNRLKHYIKFELIELHDIKGSKNLSVKEIKDKEASIFLKKIPERAYVVLLDENGIEMNSRKFAKTIEQKSLQSIKHLVFLIGGAYGFSEEMHKSAEAEISLSKMTFSHQIIRLIFMEQIYRAFTIIKGDPYHND